MAFEETIAAQSAGRAVRRARLVWFDFRSGPIGVWNGFGRLETRDGRVWLGLGGMGSVTGISQSINGKAPELLLTLSGVDEKFARLARSEADEYYNRAVVVFSQFMDEHWQCLDAPFADSWALMSKINPTKSSDESGVTRAVSVSAETPFAGKKRPRFAYVTDRDQQMRHPGDLYAERTAGIDAKPYRFPDS